MPAGLPGVDRAGNAGNPSAGAAVLFDGISGPKGSPFDKDMAGNASTGALATCIGWGVTVGPINRDGYATNAEAIHRAGFIDDFGLLNGFNSTIMYIGGGRSDKNTDGLAAPNPWVGGFAPCAAGNGGSRDAGGGVGFPTKMVTATGNVANGAVIETGFVNRSGLPLVADQSTFGSSSAPQATPS